MARAADQFRSSDVTVWGVVALCCWGAAILVANIGSLVPSNILAGLHASRLEGGTVNQLRVQVADIQAESVRMRRENDLLLQRFDLQQQDQATAIRRIGALEVSIPRIAERVPETATIDSSITASISQGKPISFEAEGGSVTVENKPLIAIKPGATSTLADEVESPSPADGNAFGVALGFPIAPDEGEVQWQSLMSKVGTLLIGLEPVLSGSSGDGGTATIVAGPLSSESQAADLCGRLDKVGIPCEPAPFKGEPLPLLN